MEAIRDINQQESEEKLRHCCRYTPEVFRDTKAEQDYPQEMWVVACPSCGKFVDHLVRESAIYIWNEFPEETERNPIDHEFIKRLENAKRGLG